MSRTFRRKNLNWREEELPKEYYYVDLEEDVAICHWSIVYGYQYVYYTIPPSKLKRLFYSDRKYYQYCGFPKSYRKDVNRKRRNHDKRELYKEIHMEGYEGLYSQWNCKDCDPMGFW